MPMMMAIKARTEAMVPKMMVPVESEFDCVCVSAKVVAGFVDGYDLRVVLVLNVDMAVVRTDADL